MRLTSNFQWPVGEGTDARRDFPAAVDGPRSDAIDELLGGVAHMEGGTASANASTTTTITNYSSTYGQTGWADTANGQITVPSGGVYHISTRIRVQPPASEYSINNSIRDATGALMSQWILSMSPGLGAMTLGAGGHLHLSAGQSVWQACYVTASATLEWGILTVRLVLPD